MSKSTFGPKSVIAIIGIILAAFTLRAAVTVFSPLVPQISQTFEINSVAQGVMGMLPTAAFAVFGFCTPFVLRWASIELLTVIAMLAAVVGQISRLFAPNIGVFMVLSVIGFAGLGAGNVLVPPLVKRYFPNKIGLVTTLYVTVLSLGTAIPSQLSVPVADAFNWQTSLGSWGVINLLAAIPWFILLLSNRRQIKAEQNSVDLAEAEMSEAALLEAKAEKPVAPRLKISPWKSPMALGLTAMMGMTSLNTYSMFAWLPSVLTDSGYQPSTAGTLLALFGALGIPLGLVVPLWATKMRNQFPLVLSFVGFFVIGYLGLMFAPNPLAPLWVVLAGLGPGTFTMSLLLINLRSRTHQGAGALSGFVQGLGYAVACLGPLLFGIFHQMSGSWYLPFGFLFVTLVVMAIGGFLASKQVYFEDQQGAKA